MLYGRRSDSRAIQDNTVVWLRELLAAGDYERLSKRAITMINHNESARFLNALSSIDVPTKRHGENHEFDRMLTAITAATILTAFLESAHDQTAAFVAYMWDVTGLTLEDPIVNQEFRSKILKAHPTSVLISHVNSYRYFADYEKFGWNVNALLQTLFSELAARPLTSGLRLTSWKCTRRRRSLIRSERKWVAISQVVSEGTKQSMRREPICGDY
jgi:hypothetical protein